jgi:hypothetical protein
VTAASHPIPAPRSPSGRRALAAATLGTATKLPPLACGLLVDALDAVTWGLLSSAGATPAEAKALLAALWVHDPEVTT